MNIYRVLYSRNLTNLVTLLNMVGAHNWAVLDLQPPGRIMEVPRVWTIIVFGREVDWPLEPDPEEAVIDVEP